MELMHLRCFVAVAEELHFGHAAQRLGLTQPPVSQRIHQLERELGTQLFQRDRRHVELTESGKAMLPLATTALREVERAAQAARDADAGTTGTLEIGFASGATFAPLAAVLTRYRADHPHVALQLHELPSEEQLQALETRQLDVAFVIDPPPRSGIANTVVRREHLFAALPSDHPHAGAAKLPLAALAEEPFILHPRAATPGTYERLIALCVDAGFTPRIVQQVTELATIVSLVATGLGIALVPDSVCRFTYPGVTYVELADLPHTFAISLAWRADDLRPTTVQFLQTAQAMPLP